MLSVGSMQTHTWLIFAGLALEAACTGIVAETSAELADPSVASSDGSEERPAVTPRPGIGAAPIAGAWDPRFTIAGFTGPAGRAPTVYDFARDIDGSIVATGAFRYVGRARVEPLLRLRNGVWQPARTRWELTPPSSGFSAVAIAPDGKLALATYDDAGLHGGQIWLDDGTGLRVIGTFDGQIRRLRWYRGQLWAAGWDQMHQGASRIQGLAVWNGAAWTAPVGGAPTGFAFELVEDGSELLVGGDFTAIGGVATSGVAAWNGGTWHPLGFPRGAAVYALTRGPDGQLYAGGALGDLGGGGGGIARWTGQTWIQVGGGVVNKTTPGVVTALTSHQGSLFAAGCFFTAGGSEGSPRAVVSRDVARFDGAWHSLDDATRGATAPWIEPLACGDEGPSSVWGVSKQAMVSTGRELLLGGSFPGVAGVESQAIIANNGAGWFAQGDPRGLGIGGSIDRLGYAALTGQVWGAGQFTHVAGMAIRAHVVRFTGDGWVPIGDAIPRDASCLAFAVAPAGDAALGCTVFPAQGSAVGQVFRVQGDRLVQIGGDLPPIQAVTYDPWGRLWVAGGGGTGFVARLDGEAFTLVESRFDAPVSQIDVVGSSDVIAAGAFTMVAGLPAAHIARWNGATWRPLGAGVPGAVTALAHNGGIVYVSSVNDGSGALLLGAFDGVAWHELATPAAGLTPQPTFNFNAIQPIAGGAIAVGTAQLDSGSGRGALVYRGGRFTALGGGVHAIGLSGLAIGRDAIWVGGLVGSGDRALPTIGVARYALAR
jgi:hypothetical protein